MPIAEGGRTPFFLPPKEETMKKFLTATAVLSTFSAAALAQSSVTTYGLLDISLAKASTGASTNSSLFQMTPSAGWSSRLGFKGREDLGGGMAALFNLEMGLAPDTGVGGTLAAVSGANPPGPSLFNRYAFVGLAGSWGTLTFGRNFTPAVSESLNANVIPSGINTGLVTSVTAQGITNDFWNNNQVTYESPSLKGVSLKMSYAPGEAAGSASSGTSIGGSVSYRNEDGLVVTWSSQKDNDATGKNVRWHFASASYVIGALKLTGGLNRVINSPAVVSTSPYQWRDSKLATLGLAYRLTPRLTLAAQHYALQETLNDTSSRQTVLNAQYDLSKRSALYALASLNRNGTMPVMTIFGIASAANSSSHAVAAGISHKF
jgi:predicted porin